jgi:hypothetical protein
MEDNKKTEQDALEQVFRTKLAYHTLPVDKEAWNGIQAKLKRQTTPHRRFINWRLPVYAAASLALLVTLAWLYMTIPENVVELHDAHMAERSLFNEQLQLENATLVPMELDSELLDVEPEPTRLTTTRRAVQTKALVVVMPETAASISEDSVENKSKVDLLAHDSADAGKTNGDLIALESNTGATDMSVKAEGSMKNQETKTGNHQKDPKKHEQLKSVTDDWMDHLSSAKKRKKPLLAAGLGSGVVGANPIVSAMEFDRLHESLVPMTGTSYQATALVPADFRDKEYAMPLSLGAKIRWQLAGPWSMESGLQYTYLQTKMKDAAWTGYSANLQLHYLGVPLGISASLLSSPKWELYWTGGMMAEKGLRSVYDEFRNWGNSVFNTHVEKSIDGWQWSMYTSFGVGYRIDQKVVLYFDPQLSYFFENEQPLSIRTEMPMMMGVSAGIRFEL